MRWPGRTRVRIVTGTLRDSSDDVVALIGEWGTAARSEVVADIQTSHIQYMVLAPDGRRVPITLKQGATATFLWASWDEHLRNNLDDLERSTQDE